MSTTTTIDTQTTVANMVTDVPARARVFETLGIDYCCGGKRPLAEVCAEKQLDPDTVIAMLRAFEAQADAQPAVDPAQLTLTQLCDHIEQTHHHDLRRELPRLQAMAQRVAQAHGGDDPRLVTLQQVLDHMVHELHSHMGKEEQILFPLIRAMEGSSRPAAHPCGSLAGPVQQMEHEHDNAGSALVQMRTLTDNYQPPAWACPTYHAYLDSLAALERDMHQHVHKENNILFPRAMELEAQQVASTSTGGA